VRAVTRGLAMALCVLLLFVVAALDVAAAFLMQLFKRGE
jgi:hypothetical protein